MKKLTVILFVFVSIFVISTKSMAAEGYKIVNKIHIPGDEKWDFLYSDDESSRLYVSHASMVQVVDETNGKVVGTISGLNGVHGIATAPTLNKGFITGGKDSSVTVFDTKTFQVIKKITVTGKGPDAILYDVFSNKVFVFNAKSDNCTVINAETNEIVGTIAFEGNPEVGLSDGKGKIYVNLESKSAITVINATTMKVEAVWSLAPGEEPTGLALDNEKHILFSACANKMMVAVNAETGKVITTLPIGEKPDGAAFDPTLKCAYSSNGEGTLTVVKEGADGSLSVLENFPTQKGARTIALNKKTHHIYLSTADFDSTSADKKKLVPGTFVVLDIMPQ